MIKGLSRLAFEERLIIMWLIKYEKRHGEAYYKTVTGKKAIVVEVQLFWDKPEIVDL